MARLREVQVELGESLGREGFMGLSVAETIRQCLKLGAKEAAAKVGREFRVPEKQFLLASIGELAAAHDWAALQHTATKLDRRSPVTAEHFVASCRWVSNLLLRPRRLMELHRGGSVPVIVDFGLKPAGHLPAPRPPTMFL